MLHAHYSPDGTALVSTPRSGHVCVWDTTTGTLLHELAYHDPEAPFGSPGPSWVSTNYSPSGEQLICVAHDQMTWWDALTAQQRVTIRGMRRGFAWATPPPPPRIQGAAAAPVSGGTAVPFSPHENNSPWYWGWPRGGFPQKVNKCVHPEVPTGIFTQP